MGEKVEECEKQKEIHKWKDTVSREYPLCCSSSAFELWLGCILMFMVLDLLWPQDQLQ